MAKAHIFGGCCKLAHHRQWKSVDGKRFVDRNVAGRGRLPAAMLIVFISPLIFPWIGQEESHEAETTQVAEGSNLRGHGGGCRPCDGSCFNVLSGIRAGWGSRTWCSSWPVVICCDGPQPGHLPCVPSTHQPHHTAWRNAHRNPLAGDKAGKVLAYISLLPMHIVFALCCVLLVRRELHLMTFIVGQLLNEVLNNFLKHTIKEPRPEKGVGLASGERRAALVGTFAASA